VEKLAIRILPCLITFINGVAVDRIVGFDELGGRDTFDTPILEHRLGTSNVFGDQPQDIPQNKSIFGFQQNKDDSDDD